MPEFAGTLKRRKEPAEYSAGALQKRDSEPIIYFADAKPDPSVKRVSVLLVLLQY